MSASRSRAVIPAGAVHPVPVFLAFAFGYFLSNLLRAVTATLAPVFSSELALGAGDLGLLAGAYFIGFAALQLPLGHALDRFGPRRTLLVMLLVAALGCAAFARATSLGWLIASRALVGAGVAACLMGSLTCYRRIFPPALQQRANAWMLMVGSSGMLASTLPVQGLLPSVGWRGLFWLLSLMLVLALLGVGWLVPADPPPSPAVAPDAGRGGAGAADAGYLGIARHPDFVRMAPVGFVVYGGMVAVQSLWAGPWLTRVSGWSSGEAAQGLFALNLGVLLVFGAWGLVLPRLERAGVGVNVLLGWGLPLPVLLLGVIAALGSEATALHWTLWCGSCTVASLCQPAVGAAFPAAQAGRALSAFNLVIFCGVFCIQWGVGAVVDVLRLRGVSEVDAFRLAMAGLAACAAAACIWFLRGTRSGVDNRG